MGRDFWKNFGVLIGAVLLSATASALIVWGMVAWGGLSYSDSARLFQAVGAVTVIFVGGVFAYWRLQIFRTFQPHLTISHEVSHRFVGESYVHIAVTAHLHNSSRVKIELHEGIFALLQISPVSDERVEDLYDDVFVRGELIDLQWPFLGEVEHTFEEGQLIIEPGGSHFMTSEFIVPSNIRSVLLYTYFHNVERAQHAGMAEVWDRTTFYDVV